MYLALIPDRTFLCLLGGLFLKCQQNSNNEVSNSYQESSGRLEPENLVSEVSLCCFPQTNQCPFLPDFCPLAQGMKSAGPG
jgi:hypothetical protein